MSKGSTGQADIYDTPFMAVGTVLIPLFARTLVFERRSRGGSGAIDQRSTEPIVRKGIVVGLCML